MTTAANFALVALSGAVGACSRYGVSLLLSSPAIRFPYATMAVNLSGALMAGFFASLVLTRGTGSSPLYLLLITGFLGSFTTLSAFSLETMRLAQSGAIASALINIVITVAGALLAVLAGAWLATHWASA